MHLELWEGQKKQIFKSDVKEIYYFFIITNNHHTHFNEEIKKSVRIREWNNLYVIFRKKI